MSETTQRFIDQVTDLGYEIEAYQGRMYWRGPAVHFGDQDELVELIRATDMPIQWDSPMFYPYSSDMAWFNANEGLRASDEDEEDEE